MDVELVAALEATKRGYKSRGFPLSLHQRIKRLYFTNLR